MSYSVEAILRLVDDVSPAVRRIATAFESLDKIVRNTQLKLDGLKLSPTLFESIDKASAAFEKFDKAVATSNKAVADFDSGMVGLGDTGVDATRGMIGGLEKFDTQVGASIARVAELEAALKKTGNGPGGLGATAGSEAGFRPTGAGPSVPIPAGGGGSHGNMRTGKGRPGHIGFGGNQQKELGYGVHASGDGLGEVIGGGLMAEFVKDALKHGFEYEKDLAPYYAGGRPSIEISQAESAAWKLASDNANTTPSENLRTILELNKATASTPTSIDLLPDFARTMGVIKSSSGGKAEMDGQALDLGRAVMDEMGAGKNPKFTADQNKAEVRKYLSDINKTAIWSRGQVDGHFLYNMVNNSGGMATSWDEDFATKYAPIMGMETKAGKYGNADYMAVKSIAQGKMTSADVKSLSILVLLSIQTPTPIRIRRAITSNRTVGSLMGSTATFGLG